MLKALPFSSGGKKQSKPRSVHAWALRSNPILFMDTLCALQGVGQGQGQGPAPGSSPCSLHPTAPSSHRHGQGWDLSGSDGKGETAGVGLIKPVHVSGERRHQL